MTIFFGIIYKITNKINGKCYVGQTIHALKERWNHHTLKSSGCKYLYNAIKKYGKENFLVEEICKCFSMEEMNIVEKQYIKDLNTRSPKGYNLTDGGDGISGYKFTEESKKKIPESGKKIQKEIHANPEYRKKQSEIQSIIQNEPERKQKQIENATASWADPTIRKRRVDALKIAGSKLELKQKKSEIWFSKSEEEKISIRKKLSKSGFIAQNKPERKEKARYYAHIQWHWNQGLINIDCEHCIAQIMKEHS